MLFIIFIFIFGLIIGSFLNVVILRYGADESFSKGKSKCLKCGKTLKWFELIPVLSFIIQKGRCRTCQSKISWQYPIVELLTGIIFALVFLKIWNLEFVWKLEIVNLMPDYLLLFGIIFYWWTIFSFLIVISVYDIRHQIIPNEFVYPLIIISLFAPIFQVWNLEFVWKLEIGNFKILLSYILSGFALYSFFALLWLVSLGRAMGYGDAKLALAMGFFLGPFKSVIAFLFSFWFGAAFGISLIIFSKGKIGLKSQIPFGPFLALGAFLAFLAEINIFQILL